MQRSAGWLVAIALLLAAAIYIVIPGNRVSFTLGDFSVDWVSEVRQGLDLQGGLRVLLEVDVPADQAVEATALQSAQLIVAQRVNALGVAEPIVQTQGDRRIVVELPGVSDPQQAVATIRSTALLQFVPIPAGSFPPLAGSQVNVICPDTTRINCGRTGTPTEVVAAAVTPVQAAPVLTDSTNLTETASVPSFNALMTGAALQEAVVTRDPQNGGWVIQFTLKPEGTALFAEYTTRHVGESLAIVLDGVVLSAPVVNSPITEGSGIISGGFTQQGANQLALQLRYGSLPVPLRVANSLEVGPTLGQDSLRKSVLAGVVGLSAIALFMLLYYRVPGVVAVVALSMYAVLVFALFILIPVTLTLPGIAGFILSVGVAVDANILIFERMKEELRAGRALERAVEVGFSRAWSSIRDSNISTLITCGILYWFGGSFGASIVQGFALTLAIGVGVSLFTAIVVTRTILHIVLDRVDFSTRHSWFSI